MRTDGSGNTLTGSGNEAERSESNTCVPNLMWQLHDQRMSQSCMVILELKMPQHAFERCSSNKNTLAFPRDPYVRMSYYDV